MVYACFEQIIIRVENTFLCNSSIFMKRNFKKSVFQQDKTHAEKQIRMNNILLFLLSSFA